MITTTISRSTKILGSVSNFFSFLMTIIICLPLPILLFFLQKKMFRIFSIYNSYVDYGAGEITKDQLGRKNSNIGTALYIFAALWLVIAVLVFLNSDLKDSENLLGNSIVVLPILFTIPGLMLCNKVKRNISLEAISRL